MSNRSFAPRFVPGPVRLGPASAAPCDLPFAKDNFVAHNVTDQSSILRFVEDNWDLDRIGDHSFDAIAGSLLAMFNFDERARREPHPQSHVGRGCLPHEYWRRRLDTSPGRVVADHFAPSPLLGTARGPPVQADAR
jgi:hypothetical protein